MMKEGFTQRFGATTALILVLLFVDRVPDLVRHSRAGVRLHKVVVFMHNGDLNREESDALAAGYYEGLRADAGPGGLPAERDDVRFRNDFLRYEFKPNVKRRYVAGMRISNSFGMANPEYLYEKPSHTRRIALLGDSMSLGPYGSDYVAALENRLNRTCGTSNLQRFQVLNFSVYGYSLLQMMEVALEKAPKFHPDAYVVALTHLEVIKNAGSRTHIGRLLVSGTDLKYDFLRQIVAEAGIVPGDHLATIRRRLDFYFVPVTRWAVEQIRDHAAAQGAPLVIVLVAAPINPQFIASDFDRLRSAFSDIGVPIIDLRDTFRTVNLDDVQIEPMKDIHPNALGHAMIAEHLWAKLRAQPDAWRAVTGVPEQNACPAGAGNSVSP